MKDGKTVSPFAINSSRMIFMNRVGNKCQYLYILPAQAPMLSLELFSLKYPSAQFWHRSPEYPGSQTHSPSPRRVPSPSQRPRPPHTPPEPDGHSGLKKISQWRINNCVTQTIYNIHTKYQDYFFVCFSHLCSHFQSVQVGSIASAPLCIAIQTDLVPPAAYRKHKHYDPTLRFN